MTVCFACLYVVVSDSVRVDCSVYVIVLEFYLYFM